MTTRNTPKQRGEEESQPSSNDVNLMAEVLKMSGTLQSVAVDVTTIKVTTSELKTAVTEMQVWVKEAETRISSLEDTTGQLQTAADKRHELVEAMWERIQVLENHSKRNNVRIIGLKETVGADGTLVNCVRKMLAEGLDIRADDAEFEIERVHRALTARPDPGKAPRPVLVRFLRQSAREKVINAAKEKRGFVWEGCRLSVFPDMTRELAEKRKAFTALKRKLQHRNVKYTLAYPATLKVRWKDKNMVFKSATAAEKFFKFDDDERSPEETTTTE